jgi:hypothetical protein
MSEDNFKTEFDEQLHALEADKNELLGLLRLLMQKLYRKGLVSAPLFGVLIARFPEEWKALQASDSEVQSLSSSKM